MFLASNICWVSSGTWIDTAASTTPTCISGYFLTMDAIKHKIRSDSQDDSQSIVELQVRVIA